MSFYKRIRKYTKFYIRDICNLMRFGSAAPMSCQRIFVDPRQITYIASPIVFDRKQSGRVIAGDWDKNIAPVSSCPKYMACVEHFVNNKNWEDAGAYDLMLSHIKREPGYDGCCTKEDIIRRYATLDSTYNLICQERRLRTRGEINPRTFREWGGVYIHIDRHGRVIFGGGGRHRLAIAKILDLPEIPAQLGVIHYDAIKTWKKTVEIPEDVRAGREPGRWLTRKPE